MDTNYTTQLFLSMLFFAPGIVLFVGLAFVGVLMLLEKTVFKANAATTLQNLQKPLDLPQNANPAPGPIVAALKEGVQQAADGQHEVHKRKAAK